MKKEQFQEKYFNVISNKAKDYFFYLIISNDQKIDDVKQSNKEVTKILSEVENNISIQGINAAQYLCLYLDDINTRIKLFKDSKPDSWGSINIGSRIGTLIHAYNGIFYFLSKINRLYGTNVYPKNLNIEIIEKKAESKMSVKAFALMHVYLAMFQGKPVTNQNKDILAKNYGFKTGNQLRNEFTYYQDENKRLGLNTENKKSACTHLQRFKDILPLLKKENNKAFEKAKANLLELEKTYKKYY